MPVALLGGWELSFRNRILAIFDNFWIFQFSMYSQKRPVILPNAELISTPNLFESSPAYAAML